MDRKSQPKNPLPDLHGYMLIVIVAAWVTGILLNSVFVLPSLILLVGTGILVLLIILLYQDRQIRFLILMMLSACLGAWRYSMGLPSNDPESITTLIGTGSLAVRGTVTDEPKVQGRSRLLFVATTSISRDSGNHWQEAHGPLEVQTLGTVIEDAYGANYGDSVELQGKLQLPPPHSPAGTFAGMAFPRISVTDTGGNPVIAFLYHLRSRLATVIAQALPQPAAALFIAIILGLRTPALQPLTSAFNVTGTAHLIVPSGFKVTILAGFVASSTRILSNRRGEDLLPAEKQRDWRRWLATACIIVSIAAYTLLSGAGSAAIRAGAMGVLMVIAPRLGRIYNVYTALACTSLLMSCIDPFVLWDTGFQLSFLGTLGIVLLTPYCQRLLYPMTHLPGGHIIVEVTAVTLAAQLATLPIFAVTFQQVSFVSPLANLLTVPLLGVFMMLGMLMCGTGVFFVPLGWLCGWVAWPVLWYTYTIVQWCASLPGAYIRLENVDVQIAWGYYLFLALLVSMLSRRWPGSSIDISTYTYGKASSPVRGLSRHTWRLMQLCMAIVIIAGTGISLLLPQANGLLTVTLLSVGPQDQPPQGEAILIHTPAGKVILIDGGMDVPSLSQALDSRLPPWQRSLALVVLTCPRQDHLAGLQDIVMRYDIGTVLDAGMLHPNTTYARWRRTISERNLPYTQVAQGDTIVLGATTKLQVLWPTPQLHAGSNEVRDNGLILQLTAPGLRMLLLSASTQSDYALAGLLDSIDAHTLQSDIVQVVGVAGKPISHALLNVLQRAQASLLVVTPAALSAAQRKMGLVSVSAFSSFPSGILAATHVMQTAQVGTLEITSDDRGWSVNLVGT